MVMTIIATLIIAVSAMVYNQYQMKLFQFNPKYRPVIVTALGGEGTTIFGFELIGNGKDKTTQLEDYITAIKYQDGDEVVDNLISDLEEDLGYNITTALAITAGGYVLASFTSGTSIPFAWFSDALLGVKSVYNVNRFYGKVSKLVDNVDPSTLNKAKSKRKQEEQNRKDKHKKLVTEPQILAVAGIVDPLLGGKPTFTTIVDVEGIGKVTYPIFMPKGILNFDPDNCKLMEKGRMPLLSNRRINKILNNDIFPDKYFGNRKQYKDHKRSSKAKRFTLHHYHQLGFLNDGYKNGAAYMFIPGILHNHGGVTLDILHNYTSKGADEIKLHNRVKKRIVREISSRYCHG